MFFSIFILLYLSVQRDLYFLQVKKAPAFNYYITVSDYFKREEKIVYENTINLRMAFLYDIAYNRSKEIMRTVMILELHRIGEEKLKVILSPFDMMKYNLTCEKLDYENTETRKALWNILDEAKHETGFDAAQGRICIEVFPEKNGGCVIYISKLKKNGTAETGSIELMKDIPAQTLAVYRFEEAEALVRVCRILSQRGYAMQSRAFCEPDAVRHDRYYLELGERPLAFSGKKAKYFRDNLFISEFGSRIDADGASAFLTEHCVTLCQENAVAVLAPLAN